MRNIRVAGTAQNSTAAAPERHRGGDVGQATLWSTGPNLAQPCAGAGGAPPKMLGALRFSFASLFLSL
jgi:hypothetical protein